MHSEDPEGMSPSKSKEKQDRATGIEYSNDNEFLKALKNQYIHLISWLGAGDNNHVFKVEDEQVHEIRVIRLSKEGYSDEIGLEEKKDIDGIMQKISHENIIKYYRGS